MKVGILTIHHVMNYGAVWQAYSLSKAVARLGFKVEIIDYRPSAAIEKYRQPLFRKKRLNFTGIVKQYLFTKYQHQKLPLNRSCCFNSDDLAAQTSSYKTIIAGSDQIWCVDSFRGYDSNFFLDFVGDPAVTKISYAASAGNTTDFGEHHTSVRQALQKFKALSVRDRSTAQLVERTCGVQPELVLDPVFLNQFEEFETPDREEMVIFAVHPRRFQDTARTILKHHRLKVVSIGNHCNFADINLKVVSPVDWLKKIKGARIILTDYFHGAAVALRFGRPVVVNAPPDKVAKITGMLEQFGLMDLYPDGSTRTGTIIDDALNNPKAFQIDVFERLKSYEAQSLNFLKTALGLPLNESEQKEVQVSAP